MALWWKSFGKSLAVSHAAIVPVLFGIAWEYYHLAKKFLSEKWIPFALLLLILEPTFITQSILMGHDLFLIYFFLLCVNALLGNRKVLYAFSICLLALHNIKGIPAAFSVGLFYFIYNRFVVHNKIKTADWLIHLLPAALWCCWLIYHQYITGWYLLTPEKDYGAKLHLGLSGLKRIGLGIWQVIDFGRGFIWVFIFCALFIYRKKLSSVPFKTLFLLLFIPLAVGLIFYAILDINLCHRYNMVSFLITGVSACYLMEMIRKRKIRYLLASVFCIGLITGNFWLYGGGFSNGWDSSLKVLPYFALNPNMLSYIKEKNINPISVGTRSPLHYDMKYSSFCTESYYFTKMDASAIDKYPYVLFSNVSNHFTRHEKEILNKEWRLEKEICAGQVCLKLFKNPRYEGTIQ